MDIWWIGEESSVATLCFSTSNLKKRWGNTAILSQDTYFILCSLEDRTSMRHFCVPLNRGTKYVQSMTTSIIFFIKEPLFTWITLEFSQNLTTLEFSQRGIHFVAPKYSVAVSGLHSFHWIFLLVFLGEGWEWHRFQLQSFFGLSFKGNKMQKNRRGG